MSWTLGQTVARVKTLLDAPDPNSYLTPDFIVPLINQVYEDACNDLIACQASWDISVVEIPGIQPGTVNLSAFQSGSQPLAYLTEQPERIDWKYAGADPSYYQLVRNYGVLPDIQPQQGITGWEWRSEIIWLTMCSIAVDLRVRGEFEPAPLAADDDVLTAHPRIGFVVAYGTAALVAAVRGNDKWAQQYESKAQEALDEIMSALVRSTQGQTRRVGKMVRRSSGLSWTATR